MADVGMWSGLEKATGTVLNTGMKLMEFDQQQKHQNALEQDRIAQRQIQTEQMRMQQDTHNRLNKLLEMQIKQKEYDDAPVNIKARLSKMGVTSENEYKILSQGLEADIENVEGEDYVPRRIAMKHFEKKFQDPQTLSELATVRIQNANARKQEIQKIMSEGKLKPEEQQALKQELDNIPRLQEQYLAAKKRADMQLKNYGADERTDIAERRLELEERRVRALERKTDTEEKKTEQKTEKKTDTDQQKAINQEIKQLDDFEKKHSSQMDDDGRLKIEALRSGLRNGSIKPGTIKYPDKVENGRLVHGKSSSSVIRYDSKGNRI